MQKQVIELQSKLSFQEQTITELNDALVSQQQQIDQLRLLVKDLRDQLENLEEALPFNQQSEKPPHY